MKKLCVVFIASIALLAGSVGHLAAAQDTTGRIAGRVVDAQGLALPGATITVTGPQGDKTAVTDNEGRFTVPFSDSRDRTRVRAELQGFAPVDRADVQVRLGQTVELPLTLQVGAVEETVQVVSATPTIDTTSTTIGATLDSATLSRLPVGRRFSDTLYLAPGVSTGGSVGVANPSIGGIERPREPVRRRRREHHQRRLWRAGVVLDRVRLARQRHAVRLHAGSPGEDRRLRGGVRTGHRRRHQRRHQERLAMRSRERIRLHRVRHSLESDYDTVQSVEGTVNTVASRLSDAGATVGGPILTNRLFFFGAIDPQWETTTFMAPEDFPLQSLGEVDRDRRITNYAAKGDLAGRQPSHRFDASFFGDPATGDNGPAAAASLLSQATSGYSSLELRRPQPDRPLRRRPQPALPRRCVVWPRAESHPRDAVGRTTGRSAISASRPRVSSGGLGFYEAGNRSNNWQVQAKATTSSPVTASIRCATASTTSTWTSASCSSTGSDLHRAERTADSDGRHRRHHSGSGLRPDLSREPGQPHAARPTTQHYTAFFVEDAWKIGNSLTIRPGLRYEQETLIGHARFRTSRSRTTGRRASASSGIRPAPAKAKVFANYGRYYARVPNDLAARALSSDASLAGRLFRSEPDAAGARWRRHNECGRPARQTTTALHAAGRRRRRHRSEGQAELLQRMGRRSGIPAGSRLRRRRAIRASRHRARARRRAAVSARGHVARPARRRNGELSADESRVRRHRSFRTSPERRSASNRRSTTTTRSSSRRTSGWRTDGR